MAPAALADPIADTSKKLADASYPLLQQIDWARSPALNKWLSGAAESWNPGKKIGYALDATLKLGMQMDQKLVASSVAAHEKAIAAAANQPGLVTPLAQHEAVTESIVRMIASAPRDRVQEVFDTYSRVGLKNINRDWFASVNPADARAAYRAFLQTGNKLSSPPIMAQPNTQSLAEGPIYQLKAPVYSDKLGAAAKELADSSYPLLKKIDWESTPVLTKWLGSASQSWEPAKIAAAVDSALK